MAAEPNRVPRPDEDLVLAQLREQITDTDRAIFEAVNRRLKLVAQIRRYKESHGLPLVDPDREERMLHWEHVHPNAGWQCRRL